MKRIKRRPFRDCCDSAGALRWREYGNGIWWFYVKASPISLALAFMETGPRRYKRLEDRGYWVDMKLIEESEEG